MPTDPELVESELMAFWAVSRRELQAFGNNSLPPCQGHSRKITSSFPFPAVSDSYVSALAIRDRGRQTQTYILTTFE